jgi:hypothetical protein
MLPASSTMAHIVFANSLRATLAQCNKVGCSAYSVALVLAPWLAQRPPIPCNVLEYSCVQPCTHRFGGAEAHRINRIY